MGIESSKSVDGADSLTRKQRDIKHLGESYPFGDDELWRLYMAYHELREPEPFEDDPSHVRMPDRVSFLSDYAMRCTVRAPTKEELGELRNERLLLTQVVERKILPEGFGNLMERRVFSVNESDAYNYEAPPRSEPLPPTDEYTRMARIERFFDGAARTSRKGSRISLGVIFECCRVQTDGTKQNGHASPSPPQEYNPTSYQCMERPQQAPARELVVLAYRLALAAAFFESARSEEGDMGCFVPQPEQDHDNDEHLLAMVESLVAFAHTKRVRDSPYGTIEAWEEESLSQGLVTQLDLFEWSESIAPLIPLSLSTMMHHIFFPELPYPPSRTMLQYPSLNTMESVFVKHTTSPLLFVMASLTKSLGGTWHRLYTSASDGMSFNRLQNALLGYGGPTLIIIQAVNTSQKSVFGACTSSPWKESKDFYGTSDCFLYQLLPELCVYRPKSGASGSGTNYMYCNSEARSRGYDQQAHGIGFGGSVQQPRLFLEESLDHCYAGSGDLTFEHGPLLTGNSNNSNSTKSSNYFELDQLEVWGVGGEDVVREALGCRQKQRDITAANLRKARKVDKAAFLDDFRSGLIESKAFKHREEIRGRADACVDDEHKNAYVYEK